ncbi:hypothetical protein MMC20_002964 [Loxospora ochrophaea]|nr:hypothetical protein [Loxospora ochrophaea]
MATTTTTSTQISSPPSKATPPSSLQSSQPSHADDDASPTSDSLLTRLILTPLLFTSFLLSLFLIDKRTHASYRHLHTSPPSSNSAEKEEWVLRAKHRKMMRMETSDAFALRKWVMGVLVLGLGAGALGMVVVGVWGWGYLGGWRDV